jgi:RHS repeat-associated protein
MVQAGGGISIVYDGDGNRVAKTVAGLTTKYLVDELNPTGYAQVLEEDDYNSSGPLAARQYVYGLELLSRWDVNTRAAHYYVYDGHGSVRALTDANGNVTDTYDYDAFGNLLHSTGTTPNNYLFAGEQFDPDLNLYYNRARYLNTSTGRFWTMDAFEGDHESPLSLHRYLYAVADPVNRVDPGGNDSYAGIIAAAIGLVVVATIAVLNYAHYTPLLQFDISTAYGLSAARFMADHAEYAARHNTDPEAFRRVFGKADPAVVSANFLVILSALYKPITFERTTFAVCGCIAEAGHGYQPAAITFRVSELFFPLPQVLTTDPFNDPRQISRGGALIHEAAHASLNAGDIGHYYDVFKLDPARALQNADSYRVYAEHIYVTH